MLTGVDPGLVRLRLAGIGTASMVTATAVMSGVRALSGQPVTVELFAAVIAMISNLAVNEPDVRRTRVTTLLMLGPATVSLTAGTLLAPHRVLADVVFVTVTMVAVYIRRFGPRGFALGMAAFMPFFLTQFLHVSVAQLPWLLLAAATGIGATLLLRGRAFAERPELTLDRFAVIRLADALEAARRAHGPVPMDRPGGPDGPGDPDGDEDSASTTDAGQPQGLALSTRQAIQVGVATSLAIVVGELVSPARWYWAVLTAFLVFAGTSSRGDVIRVKVGVHGGWLGR